MLAAEPAAPAAVPTGSVTGTGTASPPAGVPPVEATGTGALGFLIVLLLVVGVVGLGYALRGSLRRLRARQESGTFGRADER